MSMYITILEVAAFSASVFAWPALKKRKHLAVFPFLLFIIAAVETGQTFFRSEFTYFNAIVYNIQVPLQHLLYMLILYLALKTEKFKIYIMVAAVVFTIIAVMSTLYLTIEHRINAVGYCTGSIFIIVGILMTFYEMLHNPAGLNFMRDPFFYMLFAFLLFNVGTLPYFAMGNWLYFSLKRTDILTALVNVMSVFNYLLYSTYTICLIWITRKKEFF